MTVLRGVREQHPLALAVLEITVRHRTFPTKSEHCLTILGSNCLDILSKQLF